MLNVLVVHQNFPGQFRNLVKRSILSSDIDVLGVGLDTAPGMPGVKLIRYKPTRGFSEKTHPYLRNYEECILRGQQVSRLLSDLKRNGYRPDVILAHPGWGETLFVKDVFCNVPLVHYCEYFYHVEGADVGFDHEYPSDIDTFAKLRANNAMHLLNLEQCDLGITPTAWQFKLHPQAYQSKLKICHEGIDIESGGRGLVERCKVADDLSISSDDKIITYVARNLEPYRGFHSFMRAISIVLKNNPTVRVVVVGGDDVSYGRQPIGYDNWRLKMLDELELEKSRIHFTGKVSYQEYKRILAISTVHIYLTYPFVLSWSLLEAMSSGCIIVGSKTSPLEEVIEDSHNGFLVEFFDYEGIAKKVLDVLDNEQDMGVIRENARKSVLRFDSNSCTDKYISILHSVLNLDK